MNNTTPAPPAIQPEATAKFTKWAFRIFVLLVLCPIALALINKIAGMIPQQQTDAFPVFTLGCTNKDNPYNRLPDVRRLVLVVPPLRMEIFTEDFGSSSQGDKVVKLQNSLADEGFYEGPTDGNFGDSVVDAVKKYQLNYGIEQTGIADAPTRNLLNCCWTDWQMRPLGTPKFLFWTDGKIYYQDALEYGLISEPKTDGPLVRDINHTHYIVARRFKNAGNKTVNVPVDLH
jgi:hypothetical protein